MLRTAVAVKLTMLVLTLSMLALACGGTPWGPR